MEKLAIVHPETNTPVGVLPRDQAIQTGAWCQSTNVFVMNSQGQILCHQRSLQKERLPGVWSTHLGGHVGHDEDYDSNALKELSEEAGIQAAANELIAWRTTKLDKARLWVREFVVLIDKELHELVPQPGEVDQFSWMHADEILNAAQAQPELWCAGTHDFAVEYHCLKAALAVASKHAQLKTATDVCTWQPLRMPFAPAV